MFFCADPKYGERERPEQGTMLWSTQKSGRVGEHLQTFVDSKDGIPPCIPKLDGVLLL